MGTFLEPEDLTPFVNIELVKAEQMIEDSEALAILAAPCVTDNDFLSDTVLVGAVKAILRGAILRWNDTGTGAVTQTGAGSFQQTIDTRSTRRSMFWPSEIDDLRGLCKRFNEASSGAFSVDTATCSWGWHLPWCAGNMGANYCSCGTVIAGYPIYEGGTP